MKTEPGLEHLHREAEVTLHRRDRRLEPFRDARRGADGRPRTGERRGRAWAARLASGAGTAAPSGSPGTGPASSDSNRRTSAIDVASGPNVERSIQSGIGSRPITPFVGLRPARPQNAAGDPDRAAAVGGGRDRRHARCERGARAAARPARRPVGPPGVRGGAVQRIGREPRERELRLVRLARPRSRRPRAACAARARRTRRVPRPRTSATRTSRACPTTASMSFTSRGKSGERTRDPRPPRSAASIARASSNACSRTRITALSGGFRRSIRSRDSSTSSDGDVRPDRTAAARSDRFIGSSRCRGCGRRLGRASGPSARRSRRCVPGTPITPPPGCVPPPQR